jgi:hypothetical protein
MTPKPPAVVHARYWTTAAISVFAVYKLIELAYSILAWVQTRFEMMGTTGIADYFWQFWYRDLLELLPSIIDTALAIVIILLALRLARLIFPWPRRACPECGYAMAGSATTCPECGTSTAASAQS